MSKDELRTALCAEADGDLKVCVACLHKCLIGRRLLNWQDKKHYTTVGVPERPQKDSASPSRTARPALHTSAQTRDEYNAQRGIEASEKVSRGLAVLKAGGTRDEAVKASHYSGWKAFYDAVVFRGRKDEILDDRSNAAKSAEAKRRFRLCFDELIAGKPIEQIAADHGYKSVDSLLAQLRENRNDYLPSEYDDYGITRQGLVKGKRRCTRNTKSPQKTCST